MAPKNNPLTQEQVESWHKNLSDDRRDWLKNVRGLSDEIINEAKLGWDGSFITIPVKDASGAWLFVKRRYPPEKYTKDNRYLNASGSTAALYGAESIKDADTVLIAEGEFDSLVLRSKGFVAVSGTVGANTFDPAWAKSLESIPNVYVIYDNDDAGRDGERKVGAMIPHAKIVHLPEEIGEKGDVTDFFMKLGKSKDDLLELLKIGSTIGEREADVSAEGAPEPDLMEILERIPKETPKYKLPDALDEFFHALARESLAKINVTLHSTVKDRFNLINDNIKAFEKTVLAYKRQLAIEEQSEEEEELETFTDEELALGKETLQSPTLLYDVLAILKRSGLVGEEGNALIHYLAFTSRLLKQPISITVKGDSSAGKSFTLGKAMALMPKSAYIDLTDATPQSFYYGKPDLFKHRIIVIFERNGAERTDYTMRSLQSEGKLSINVTVKNPETGAFEAKKIVREGPAGFITTTTSSQINPENETRNLSIFPDQTIVQTQRIYGAANDRYLGKQKLSENEIRPFQAAQTLLVGYPVLIPFVSGIHEHFPHDILRTRRDYPRFLSIIEVSALLHQEQRQKVEQGGVTYLKATLADYEIARFLTEKSLVRSMYEIPPKTLDLIEGIKTYVENQPNSNDQESSFTITAIAKHMGWDRDTVANWLEPAEKKTLVTRTEEAKGNKGARYRLEYTAYRSDNFLPNVDVIAGQHPDEPLDGIYNPLTGEPINIKLVDTEMTLQALGLEPETKESDGTKATTQPEASLTEPPSSDLPF